MRSTFCQGIRTVSIFVVVAFVAILGASANTRAQTHVVSPSQLHDELMSAAQTRETNTNKVLELFTLPKSKEALQTAHTNLEQVKSAMAGLSDQELAQLAARAQKAQKDFAGGDISNRDLLWIIAGIAALILIIVAVR